ncbi:hypothetical protein Trydic_g6784 [Trypoxylus dichotomus]
MKACSNAQQSQHHVVPNRPNNLYPCDKPEGRAGNICYRPECSRSPNPAEWWIQSLYPPSTIQPHQPSVPQQD